MKTDRIILVSILMMAFFSCHAGREESNIRINFVFPKGDPAPSHLFTNRVWLKMLPLNDQGELDTQIYHVTFEASARTNWHSHPGGQILLVTEGKGYHQQKGKAIERIQEGDLIFIAPNVEHWHGASPEGEFSHLGISPQVRKGAVQWLKPVTDQEYELAESK